MQLALTANSGARPEYLSAKPETLADCASQYIGLFEYVLSLQLPGDTAAHAAALSSHGLWEVGHAVICPHRLDFRAAFLFIAPNPRRATRLRAADRDLEIPEVNTRQRDAPSGACWLCVLFSSRKSTTFPGM
ncbi:hypothetical protein ACCS95_04435 [Rhizobium ruizarguesonis]